VKLPVQRLHELILETIEEVVHEKKDPKVGTGKKPKGSGRRLYTDEDPSDTVSVKFSTVQDIKDTFSKASFKSKSHKRQSQIINLVHQRVRAAHKRAKDPEVKARLGKALKYAIKRKEASKKKTKRMQKEVRMYIETVVRDFLLEKTRAEKEGVKLQSVADELKNYVEIDGSGVPINYVTFTKINKVGINPRSSYDTPNGIYTYPLTKRTIQQLIAGDLPFAQDAPYVSLLQPQDRDAIITSNLSPAEYQKLVVRIYDYSDVGQLVYRGAARSRLAKDIILLDRRNNGTPTYEQISATRSYTEITSEAYKQTPLGKLWNITRIASGEKPNVWSSIWRSLDVDGVLDLGTGVIYSAEPTQAVFFARNVVDLVKTFVNKETPSKIDKRKANMFKAAAGKLTFSAFRRNGVYAEFNKFQSWSFSNRWLMEKLRYQLSNDLELMWAVGSREDANETAYPWMLVAKQFGIYPREKDGFVDLVKSISNPGSEEHKAFWEHPQTIRRVWATYLSSHIKYLEVAGRGEKEPGELITPVKPEITNYIRNSLYGAEVDKAFILSALKYADEYAKNNAEPELFSRFLKNSEYSK